MARKPYRIPNPAAGNMKPVELITDRAKRYRAQAAIEQPDDRCIYCGQPKARDIDHISGDESDGAPANLAHACRSCNTTKGAWFVRNGIGEKTRQYNPKRRKRAEATGPGATTLKQWVTAVASIKGEGSIDTADAIALIRATPPERRSRFAHEIWDIRRQRGTDRSRVPF